MSELSRGYTLLLESRKVDLIGKQCQLTSAQSYSPFLFYLSLAFENLELFSNSILKSVLKKETPPPEQEVQNSTLGPQNNKPPFKTSLWSQRIIYSIYVIGIYNFFYRILQAGLMFSDKFWRCLLRYLVPSNYLPSRVASTDNYYVIVNVNFQHVHCWAQMKEGQTSFEELKSSTKQF